MVKVVCIQCLKDSCPLQIKKQLIIIIIISLFSHMVIHYVTHIKHVLKYTVQPIEIKRDITAKNRRFIR